MSVCSFVIWIFFRLYVSPNLHLELQVLPCCAVFLTAVYIVSIYSDEDAGQDTLSDAGETNGGFALVISGHSLVFALNAKYERLFLEVASSCKCN